MPDLNLNGTRNNILLVDDESLFLELMKELLEAEGISTIATDSSVNAMNIIDSKKIHLLITDINMPEINGIDLAVKAKLNNPPANVIFITGLSEIFDQYKARLNFSDYVLLKKPFPLDNFVRLVKDLAN